MKRTALARTVDHLAARGVPFALCGGLALARWGHPRATTDADLLAGDPAVLAPGFWRPLYRLRPEVRTGGGADPLRGRVRLGDGTRCPVDVVVPRGTWVGPMLARAAAAEPVPVDGAVVPVVDAADLVLLQLFAGGEVDRQDVAALLAADGSGTLRATVDARIGDLPEAARALWRALRSA